MKQTIKSLLAGLVLALCMPLTAAADDIPIDEEHFPDANFRSWLTSQSYGKDKILTDAEIQKITSIDVSSRSSIKDLTGIKYFTALTELTCKSNQLTSLDVSNHTELTTLTCSSNSSLTSLDVSGCSALTTLTCSGNSSLTSLDVSGCSALTTLTCNSNSSLTSLDVSGCSALTTLTCGYNSSLTSLDVSGCSALKTLDCYFDNQLTSLDVSECSALTTLLCYYSRQLTSLDASGCSALKTLRCYSNQLTSLDVSGCSALTELVCNDNQLTSLDASGCSALKTLQCYTNQLTSLDVSGCLALEKLHCYSNQLTSLDVSNHTKLTDLLCYRNQLIALDCHGCTQLKSFSCQFNQIRYLDVTGMRAVASSSTQSRTEIRCYDNQLNGIYMSAFISTLPSPAEYDGDWPQHAAILFINTDLDDANSVTKEQYDAIYANGKSIIERWALYSSTGSLLSKPSASGIPEIEVSVDANGLATYCPFVGIDFTNATKIAAYRATLEGNTVKLTRVYKVRRCEGVLLRSLDGGAATESLPGLMENPDEEENAFKGIKVYEKDIMVQETDDNVTNFVLSKKNGVIGFYKAKPEGTKVAAGKAYLPVENYDPTAAEGGLRVEFEDGEALGIDGVETQKAEQDDATYTLSGIRIDRPTAKGIYIRNGKKIVIQ